MIIEKLGKNTIQSAVSFLEKGGLVVYPSDTVYGALVDATNPEAVAKLISFKNRPPGKPISVFVSDRTMLDRYASIPKEHRNVLQTLLPGPFTLILPSTHAVSKSLESERGTIGIRLPQYDLILSLVEKFGKPVTATSANLSGRSPHYSLDALLAQFPENKKTLIDLAVDGGKLPRNKPSTIIDLTHSQLTILRSGDIGIVDYGTFISRSVKDTEKIAQHMIKRMVGSGIRRPVVFILKGEMGTGKTVFVKAAGQLLGVEDIISPTYVIYYEYNARGYGVSRLVHADFFNIEDPEEFEHLGFEDYLNGPNVIFIEWGEKSGQLYEALKAKADIVYIEMSHQGEANRHIRIKGSNL